MWITLKKPDVHRLKHRSTAQVQKVGSRETDTFHQSFYCTCNVKNVGQCDMAFASKQVG